MLFDRFNRTISYLRISVTERCNFRCVYCMPEQGIALAHRDDLLSFEEIVRVVRVGAKLGLSKIRLTGGEPTVRRGLPDLIKQLSGVSGIREIAMTTNAARLAELARPLKAAGLARLNISLNSLQKSRVNEIARRDCYDRVFGGINEAVRAGYENLKLTAW